eukprot:SAG31_NODE_11606_length_1014_cov_0.480874_2_plen_80_part_00
MLLTQTPTLNNVPADYTRVLHDRPLIAQMQTTDAIQRCHTPLWVHLLELDCVPSAVQLHQPDRSSFEIHTKCTKVGGGT